jgi:transcriptional regulator with XRE-family HTH domain
MQRLGEKLRILRERNNVSLRKLASDLGMKSHAHLGRIETGEKKPSAELILTLADYFNVTTDVLMRDEQELSPSKEKAC